MTTTVIVVSNPASAYGDINGNVTGLSSGANVLILPANNYVTGFGAYLDLPAGVTLKGEGESATVIEGVIQANGAYSGIEKTMFAGPQNQSLNTMMVGSGGIASVFRDCIFFYGYSAVYTDGTDCHFDNCHIGQSYGVAQCTERGASWFNRCKFDSGVAGGVGGSYWGFYQADAIAAGVIQEVHFDQCDFSGTYYNWSYVCSDNYNMATVFHDGSVFSTGVWMNGCLMHGFNNCEHGGQVQNVGNVDCVIASCSTTNGGSVTVGGTVTTSGNWGVP